MPKITNFGVIGFLATALFVAGSVSGPTAVKAVEYNTDLPYPDRKVQNNDLHRPESAPIRGQGVVSPGVKKDETEKPDDSTATPKKFFQAFTERFEKAVKNLEAVHQRLSALADRIDSRLKKLSSEGVDVVASFKFTATAREELRLAKVSVEAAKSAFATEGKAEAKPEIKNPTRAIFLKTIANVATAKEHLKKAHQNLVWAISNVKAGINKDSKTGGRDGLDKFRDITTDVQPVKPEAKTN